MPSPQKNIYTPCHSKKKNNFKAEMIQTVKLHVHPICEHFSLPSFEPLPLQVQLSLSLSLFFFNLVEARCTTLVCNSHNSHVKRNIITLAMKGNSVQPQKMKGNGEGLGEGRAMTLHRLLLSVERASTTLEFNAFPQRCPAHRTSGEITACSH